MTTARPLGLGVVGAGNFAWFFAAAVSDLDSVRVAAVADLDADRARRLAAAHGAAVRSDWQAVLADEAVDVVVVATSPASHALITLAALAAGRHVLCEKPLALTTHDAAAVRAAAHASGRVVVVDHVLRYNPLLRLLGRLRAHRLLGTVLRVAVENDAADEDLPAGHWFWDDATSGGILVEHGVHFFDAAVALLGCRPVAVQAIGAERPDGEAAGVVDAVVATAVHPGGALATFAHGFSHAHRCERQLMRVDFGTAEARLVGWIPVTADLDIWTDDAGADALARLPDRAAELLAVPGHRLSGAEVVTVEVQRGAGPGSARARGLPCHVPHRVRARIDLGGAAAKSRVYAESVRAAMHDLVTCAATGAAPAAGVEEGWAAVAIATAAEEARRSGTTVLLRQFEPTF